MEDVQVIAAAVPRSRAVETVLTAGLTAGVLDGLDAVVFYGLYAAVPAGRLFQGIASGLIGRAAFGGGWATIVLGVLLHFTIATGAAAIYYAASRRIPLLLDKPVLCGLVFGLLVFLTMQHVVLPLSAVTPRKLPMPPAELADQLFSHTCFVGLSIALLTRKAR